ncbi:MAG: hypothetical protein HKM93_20070 [Desulfobacteraceae bacterium]|nr:hypothetical protein [Desulfobacteraceae bacterium]
MKNTLVLFSLILFVCCGCDSLPDYAMSVEGAYSDQVLSALISISDVNIPREKLSCEINGSDSAGLYNDVTVGDFMTSFILSSHSHLSRNNQFASSIACIGEETLVCNWIYGIRTKSGEESWDMVLRFTYDAHTESIRQDSLACIQVP